MRKPESSRRQKMEFGISTKTEFLLTKCFIETIQALIGITRAAFMAVHRSGATISKAKVLFSFQPEAKSNQ